MPNRCVAYGCNNTNAEKGISTFKFPKEGTSLRRKWISQVKRTRSGWSKPGRHSVVCSEHFTTECFEDTHKLHKAFGLKLHKNFVSKIKFKDSFK